MNPLARYEAARAALAEAKRVDEVKDIRDQADAMRHYARMAKDRDMEADALEIRVRAERRLGELIDAQKRTVGLNKGGGPGRGKTGVKRTPDLSEAPTLEEAGIDKNLAKRARQAHHIPEKEFEDAIAQMRKRAIETTELLSANIIQQNDPQFKVTLDRVKETIKARKSRTGKFESEFSFEECIADLARAVANFDMAVNAIVRHKNEKANIDRNIKGVEQSLGKLRAWYMAVGDKPPTKLSRVI